MTRRHVRKGIEKEEERIVGTKTLRRDLKGDRGGAKGEKGWMNRGLKGEIGGREKSMER